MIRGEIEQTHVASSHSSRLARLPLQVQRPNALEGRTASQRLHRHALSRLRTMDRQAAS